MASFKYFLVTRLADSVKELVRAPKDSLAIATVAGDASAVRLATDDDIANNAGKLHPKSIEAGSGRYFIVDGQIVRAKNPANAFALVNGDAYEAKLLNQDELVEQLNQGLKPVHYVEPSKPAKGASAPDAGASTAPAGDAAAALPDAQASNDDEAAQQPAVAAG